MKLWTLEEIKTKIEQDLDLEGEDFIQDTEMLGYINEAIDEAEAEIHTIYEDYFLTRAFVSVTAGTNSYVLPDNIYAQKIRKIMYRDGSRIYPIARIAQMAMFEDIEVDEQYGGNSSEYRYYLMNDAANDGTRLCFSPPMQDTGAEIVRMYYLRNANRLAVSADRCDIPEAVGFVIAYAKWKCVAKEDPQRAMLEEGKTEKQRKSMIDTLTNRVPDNDTLIEMDTSAYEDMN